MSFPILFVLLLFKFIVIILVFMFWNIWFDIFRLVCFSWFNNNYNNNNTPIDIVNDISYDLWIMIEWHWSKRVIINNAIWAKCKKRYEFYTILYDTRTWPRQWTLMSIQSIQTQSTEMGIVVGRVKWWSNEMFE